MASITHSGTDALRHAEDIIAGLRRCKEKKTDSSGPAAHSQEPIPTQERGGVRFRAPTAADATYATDLLGDRRDPVLHQVELVRRD